MTIRARTPYGAAFCTIFFWASAFPGVKYALDAFSPEALMLLRFAVATAVLWTCLLTTTKGRLPRPSRAEAPLIGICGVVGIFLYMWLFNTGAAYVPSGVSSFVISFAPVVTLVLSIALLKEKPTARTVAGVLMSLAGLILIMVSQAVGFQLSGGMLILVAAVLCFGVFNVLQRKLLRGLPALATTTYCVTVGTAAMLVFLPRLAEELPNAPIAAVGVVVYLGVFPAALAYWLWGVAMSRAESTASVANFMYLTPFLSSLIAFVWLGEVIAPLAVMGGLVIIAGMLLASARRALPARRPT